MLKKNLKTELSFWQANPNLQNNLIAVQKIIQKQIDQVAGSLGTALRYHFASPGKMLRPALMILFSQFSDEQVPDKILRLAASVEMLHNATLIHDDIIDESSLRHGQESIQSKFGKHIAVYAGDYLFAVSLTLLSTNTKAISSVRTNSKTMMTILQGETAQYDRSYHLDITFKQYLQQIYGKTAILFGLASFLGSFESGQGWAHSLKAKKFAEELGLAFQLRDDILDYTASEAELKKPILLDVRDGVYSGPLILALKNDHGQELKQLVAIGAQLKSDQLRQIQQLVIKLGGVKKAQQIADRHTQKALQLLQRYFPDNENRAFLQELTEQLLDRKY